MSNINSPRISNKVINSASNRFCANINCMARLSTKANFCYACGRSVRCSSCKTDITEPNASFCSACGNSVSVPMASTQSDEVKLRQAVHLSMNVQKEDSAQRMEHHIHNHNRVRSHVLSKNSNAHSGKFKPLPKKKTNNDVVIANNDYKIVR